MTWRRILLALALITFLIYLPSFSNRFVWDDEQFIYNNAYVKTFNLSGILFENTIAGAGEVSNYYRPLTTFTFAVDHLIWGLNPLGFHITNTLLHIGAGLLLVGIFYELAVLQTPHAHPQPHKQWWIWLVPALFLLHPIQTEAVTYVNSRGDSLFALLVFASVYLFLRGQRGKVTWQLYDQPLTLSYPLFILLSLTTFILSLFSKETALAGVGLFVIITGLAQLRQASRRPLWRWWGPTLTVLLIALAYLGLRATVLNFNNSFNFYGQETAYTKSLNIRLGTFAHAHVIYLQLVAFPWPLHMERTIPLETNLFNQWSLIIGLFHLVWLGAGYWEWRQHKTALIWIGWGWWGSFLLPVSGIIPINGLLYEHWLYLPLVGLSLSLIRVGSLSFAHLQLPKPLLQKIVLPGSIIVFSIYGALVIRQNYLWGDPIRFYEYTLQYGQTARLYNNLGMAYADHYRYPEAIAAYQKALALDDHYPQIYHNLGNTYLNMGKKELALNAFEQVLRISPHFYFSYPYLINLYLDQGDDIKAWPLLDALHQLQPTNPTITRIWSETKAKIEATPAARPSRSL